MLDLDGRERVQRSRRIVFERVEEPPPLEIPSATSLQQDRRRTNPFVIRMEGDLDRAGWQERTVVLGAGQTAGHRPYTAPVHISAAAVLAVTMGSGAVVRLVWVGLGVPSILPLLVVGFAAEKRGGRRG